jgi:hypothetical protein
MLTESRKQEGKPFPGQKLPPNRHSRQAYIIIKTIHLMNFTNADTLAPIVKMRRSETASARGVVRSHSEDPKNLANLLETAPAWQAASRLERSGWMLVGDRALL